MENLATTRSTAERFRKSGLEAARDAWKKSEPAAPPPVQDAETPSRSPVGARSRRGPLREDPIDRWAPEGLRTDALSLPDPSRSQRLPADPESKAVRSGRVDARRPLGLSPYDPTVARDLDELRVRHLLSGLSRQRSALDEHQATLERDRALLDLRSTELDEQEARLHTARETLVRLARSISVRERALKARETAARSASGASPSGIASPPALGRETGPSPPTDEPVTEGRRPKRSHGASATVHKSPELPSTPSVVERGGRRYDDRLPSGTARLDDLLLGGLPPRSHVVLVGDPFVGKEVALYAFLAEGLRKEERVILVTANRSSKEVTRAFRTVLPDFTDHEKAGHVVWVDASGTGATSPPNRLAVRDSDDRPAILAALGEAARWAQAASPDGRFRLGFVGLSAVLAHNTERENFLFLQNVLGVLRPLDGLAMYALEPGALSEHQFESFLGRMDGAVLFRQERGRTLLSVKGFGDVATRDWVECRLTDREMVLGSFALERIR